MKLIVMIALVAILIGCSSTKVPREELQKRSEMRQAVMNVCQAGLCY